MKNLIYREEINFDNQKKFIDGMDLDVQRNIWFNVLKKLPSDSSREDILLIITKEFLLNGIDNFIMNEYSILYKPSRYSDVNINREISLKYELIGENLYIYDRFVLKEHMVKYKVTKINGVEVQDLIEYIDKEKQLSPEDICKILMHKELLKPINQKEHDDYKITIIVDGMEQTLSLNNHIDYKSLEMFEKKHSSARILSKANFSENTNFNEEINNKLAYAYDSSNKLLKILLGLSRSDEDRQLFNNLLEMQGNLYDINFESEQYLDWMYISSFFLFYDKSLENLPEYVYEELERTAKNFNCFFLDEANEEVEALDNNYGCNYYLLEEDITNQSSKIDYSKLIKSIRNAFAHSSYEVIDENYIRIYGYNEETNELNVNLKVHKEFIIQIIKKLMISTNLNNLFPCCCLNDDFGELIGEYKSLETKEEVVQFLDNIAILNLEKINFDNLDRDFLYSLEMFKNYSHLNSLNSSKKLILHQLKTSRLNRYMDYQIKEIEFPKNYVIKRIEQLGEDFYKHSLSNQFIIINEIVREKLLSEKNIASIIFDVIGFGKEIKSGKSSGHIVDIIDETAVGYVHYNKYIQATFISYLNSILLYGYDKNYSNQIDCHELNFSRVIEIDQEIILKSKRSNLKQLRNQRKNISESRDKLIKAKENAEKKLNNANFLNNAPENTINNTRELLLQYQHNLANWDYEGEREKLSAISIEILETQRIIEEIETGVFDINKYVLEHIRNSLAHGNISFPKGFDFNDIGNTSIKIEDYNRTESRKKTFEGTIFLKDLLKEINHESFLTSIYSRLGTDGLGRG